MDVSQQHGGSRAGQLTLQTIEETTRGHTYTEQRLAGGVGGRRGNHDKEAASDTGREPEVVRGIDLKVSLGLLREHTGGPQYIYIYTYMYIHVYIQHCN